MPNTKGYYKRINFFPHGKKIVQRSNEIHLISRGNYARECGMVFAI